MLWGKNIMIKYQEKNFVSLLERFKKEDLSKAKEYDDNDWRKAFGVKYPRDSIRLMQLEDYLIYPKGSGNPASFCRSICSELKKVFHINVSDKAWQDTFGISLKCGTQLTLSGDLESKFGNDYDSAFAYIKNEIVMLLEEIDKNNYMAVECCGLSYDMKYMLLIIYCPEKILPVCNRGLLLRYCERIGLSHDDCDEIIYYSNLLIQWKNDVPEICDWSYSEFVSFCDWLYRKNQIIDGNLLRREARISVKSIVEEIDSLNLYGKSKEAVVKVRVNQGVFRDKLLQNFSCCCLCGASNKNLLIASHIKPWNVCEPEEKLDGDNGFLMCPNHDRLFDQGWITFSDAGRIIISDSLLERDRIALNVRDNMQISLTDKNKKYLQYHRNDVFKNVWL